MNVITGMPLLLKRQSPPDHFQVPLLYVESRKAKISAVQPPSEQEPLGMSQTQSSGSPNLVDEQHGIVLRLTNISAIGKDRWSRTWNGCRAFSDAGELVAGDSKGRRGCDRNIEPGRVCAFVAIWYNSRHRRVVGSIN
jgi:hypothetical protein